MVQYCEMPKPKGFGGGKRKGPRTGSRRYVVISGSVLKWWRNEWRFTATRWNSAVATSLSRYAMVTASLAGREQKVEERYTDFEKLTERMVGLVGLPEWIKIVQWING